MAAWHPTLTSKCTALQHSSVHTSIDRPTWLKSKLKKQTTPKERLCAYVYACVCVWLTVREQGVLREGGLGERALSLSFPKKEIKRKEQERSFLPAAQSCAERCSLLVCWSNRELPFAVTQEPKMSSYECLSYQKILKHNIESLSGCEGAIKLLFGFERASLAFKHFLWWPLIYIYGCYQSIYFWKGIHNKGCCDGYGTIIRTFTRRAKNGNTTSPHQLF